MPSRPSRNRRRLAGLDVWSAHAPDVTRVCAEEETDATLVVLAATMAERALNAGDVPLAVELVSLGEALAESGGAK